MKYDKDTYYKRLEKQIEHYKKYPQLIPFVGRKYKAGGILLLLESHYLPEESRVHLDAKKWYNGRSLSKKEKCWINTRGIINDESHWRKAGGTETKEVTIGRINLALIEALGQEWEIEKRDNMFQYFCCMNAFQRPSKDRQSIAVIAEPMDSEISREVIQQVIKILKPGCICFVSKRAGYRFSEIVKEHNVQVEICAHAASRQWYSEGEKERFKKIIKKNKRLIKINMSTKK